MKNKKIKELILPKNFVINSELDNKYNEQPLFKDKIDRANHILKTVGLPKFS